MLCVLCFCCVGRHRDVSKLEQVVAAAQSAAAFAAGSTTAPEAAGEDKDSAAAAAAAAATSAWVALIDQGDMRGWTALHVAVRVVDEMAVPLGSRHLLRLLFPLEPQRTIAGLNVTVGPPL